jgi:hypothetical protein
MKQLIVLFAFLSLAVTPAKAQHSTVDPPHIKTVIFKPVAVNAYAPIIPQNGSLMLSFDDLNADEADYWYRVTHCEFDGSPSRLATTEYIDGYAEDRIRTYENSLNTLQPYTNYKLTLPNSKTRFKLSGNYVLDIIDDDGAVVFSRDFIVYESRSTVGVAVYRSRDISKIQSQQAVEFIVNLPGMRVNNPAVEILPVVIQNNNPATAITGLKPQFYRGTQLLYKYNAETSYWAGNEFHYFDTKAIRTTTLNIGRVVLDDLYNSFLYTHSPRRFQPYTLNPDINGNFVVRILGGYEPEIEADYSWVHFSLDMDRLPEGDEIFISGNFNNWQLSDTNRLEFNTETGLYEKAILLKQGFYNYQYLIRRSDGALDNHFVDGSHFQTENDYTVIIYYREIGERYTRVIGVGYGNSEKINN